MRAIAILALNEFLDGLRNRWVASTILLLGTLALALLLVGAAPTGTTRTGALDISVVSLTSLSVYLLPLIALLLSYDALVGEFERGTMLLLLTYPVARYQVVLGKFLGHITILMVAVVIGYGGAALITVLSSDSGSSGWQAYVTMMASSLLLGAVFIALGYLVSVTVRERSTAAGGAIVLWLGFVVLYDLALFGLLLADHEQRIGQQLFTTLMLFSPADTYRLLNLSAFESVGQVAGIAEVAARSGLGMPLLLGLLFAWVVLPLTATILLFRRREL